MGVWGTGISSNDTYADVYAMFFDRYNNGADPKNISVSLLADYKETIADPDDSNNFWFALARAQWECKQLDVEVLGRVERIIRTGADLDVWRRLDADEKTVKKRLEVLEEFLTTLQTERPKPKARKKKIIREPVFEKGDCIAFKLKNGNFGGAVVLEADRESGEGYSLIAVTRINQPIKPTKKDFEKAEVLVSTLGALKDSPYVSWFHPRRYRNVKDKIEIVARISVEKSYTTNKSPLGFNGDFDLWVIQVADQAFESERSISRSTKRQTIKDLTKTNRWKIW